MKAGIVELGCGVRIAYDEVGSGKPILLVHGLSENQQDGFPGADLVVGDPNAAAQLDDSRLHRLAPRRRITLSGAMPG